MNYTLSLFLISFMIFAPCHETLVAEQPRCEAYKPKGRANNAISEDCRVWLKSRWLFGGLLAAGVGAGAGYAAGGDRGPRGRRGREGREGATGPMGAMGSSGPIGPTGPMGATGPTGPTGATGMGVVYNTTDPIEIGFANTIVGVSPLVVRAEFYGPTGDTVVPTTVQLNALTPTAVLAPFTLPAPLQKLEGVYQIRLVIEVSNPLPSSIGTFFLNGIPMMLVSGSSPSFPKLWLVGEEVILVQDFPF